MLVDGLLVIYINMCSISHVSCEFWKLDKLDKFDGYKYLKPPTMNADGSACISCIISPMLK